MEVPGLVDRQRRGRVIGVPATTHQAADDHLLRIVPITPAQPIQISDIVAIDVASAAAGRVDPFAARPPGGGGHEERQAGVAPDVQVLPADGLESRAFRAVMDESRIDQMGVQFQVAVAAQALDDRPLAEDARKSFEKFRERKMVHV